MVSVPDRLAQNYRQVQIQIQAACDRCGRDPASVRLVAVTKYAAMEWVAALLELGVRALGESRPQQLLHRADKLPSFAQWHLIGHLQRNKVRSVLPRVSYIHSVDSMRLFDRIDRLAAQLSLRPRALLEVNLAAEPTKDGFSPDQILAEWPSMCRYQNVAVVGLMTMAPFVEDPDRARPVFRELRRLRNQLRELAPQGPELPELSMGMSNDFQVAVEEGATMVRIGSLLFNELSEEHNHE